MIRKFLYTFFTFSLFYFATAPAADKHYVKGKVIDESGEALSGVTVRVKEQKSIGTSTDEKGEFSILLPENGKHLLFTFIGMNDNSVAVSPKTTYITVQMEIQSTETDQVVITGYAQTTTKKMTGSVGVIDGKNLQTSHNRTSMPCYKARLLEYRFCNKRTTRQRTKNQNPGNKHTDRRRRSAMGYRRSTHAKQYTRNILIRNKNGKFRQHVYNRNCRN